MACCMDPKTKLIAPPFSLEEQERKRHSEKVHVPASERWVVEDSRRQSDVSSAVHSEDDNELAA